MTPRLMQAKLSPVRPMPSGPAPVSMSPIKMSGGARRDRTDDLLLAKQALSQLSYGPSPEDASQIAALAGARLRGSKVGVPTEAALAAKVGGPGKI